MLYYAYQAHCDALAPVRLFADAARDLLDQPWPVIGDLPLVRGAVDRHPVDAEIGSLMR